MIDIISLISSVGGLIAGVGIGVFTKSGRIKSKSDAFKAMAEAYEYRITSLHEIVNKYNQTEKEHASRVEELNHIVNDKNNQIRLARNEVLISEREINRINGILLERERFIAELKVAVEYLLEWRCEHPECGDKRGRRPPNGKLQGKQFEMPKIVAYLREKSIEMIESMNSN